MKEDVPGINQQSFKVKLSSDDFKPMRFIFGIDPARSGKDKSVIAIFDFVKKEYISMEEYIKDDIVLIDKTYGTTRYRYFKSGKIIFTQFNLSAVYCPVWDTLPKQFEKDIEDYKRDNIKLGPLD